MNRKLLFFIVLAQIISTISFAQTNQCNNNAGGQLTVDTSCSPTVMDVDNNNDYWDSASGCNAADYDDKWAWFTATSTSTTITYDPDTGFDAVLHLFDSVCSATMSSIACSDSGLSSDPETITYATTIGQTYHIRVQRWNSNVDMTGTICVYDSSPVSVSCSGTTTSFYDSGGAGGAYSSNETLSWTFDPDGAPVTATFTSFSTESSFDYLYVYDGPDSSSPLLGSYSGSTIPGPFTSTHATGSLTFVFISDNSVTYPGWEATICGIENVPTPPTNDDCSTSTVLTPGESCSPTSGTTLAATSSGIAACSGNASDDVWYTFTATAPIQTITVTEGTLSDAVFEIFTGNCGSLTSALCVDDSYVDESAEITGFTAGSTYYIRVHSYGSNSGTFDICIVEPCSLGDGMGVTSLSCPSVLSGGLGLNGLDPSPVNCTAADTCVDLEATYLEFGDTTDYDVESIPYNPPYQYGCLANPISVGVDDIWSPVINLPFDFCFYGNTYNQCVAGSNGMISFNIAYATNSSGYEFSNNLPSSASGLFPNTIYGVYHDIDPSEGGEVGWELITLNTGCRALVVSYKDVPMFNDNSILYKGMMVLYENTNVIEVYISQKNIDSYDFWYDDAWNWGNAIVGIQNSDATQAVVAPGRNALDTNWAVTNEAWRFTPSGGSLATSTVSWYENYGMPSETLIGNGDTIQVCPASTTTYTAEIEYSLCNGLSFMETDNTTVTVNGAKVWNGSASSDWYTDSNWTPNGVPNNTDCIVIPDLSTTNNSPIVVGTPPVPPPAGVGLNLTVKNNGYLEIEPYGTIKITDWVDIQGNAVLIVQ